MKNLLIGLLLLLTFALSAFAQSDSNQTPPPPCSQPEFSQFDFWVGDWDATWSDTLHGSNHISKDYNGCVIIEKFDSSPASSFKGMSVSTYNVKTQKWQQTWVDNNGAYLDFTGGWEKDKMVLSRSFVRNDSTIFQRMVWHDISEKAFLWNWESSLDGGQNWQVLWQINYQRQN